MRRVSRRFTLPDGRSLGYDDHGPPSGKPILFFHGTPSSRHDWYLFGDEHTASALGIRMIFPDRPGLGLSAYQAGRQVGDWPADVAALADGLGLERFAVLGYSGGAPYVAACALQIPGRLTAAGIVSGTGPRDVPGAVAGIDRALLPFLNLACERPQLCGSMFMLLARLARGLPNRLIVQAMAIVPEPDRSALTRTRHLRALLAGFGEALRPGPRGAILDTALMISHWGFDPRGIQVPVHLWHGEEDRFVSPAAALYQVETFPGFRVSFFPGEGHLSLLVNRAPEILRALASGDPA